MNEPTPPEQPRQSGRWSDYPQMYKSPEDFLSKILTGFVRQAGGVATLKQFGISTPPDWRKDQALPLEQELLILYQIGGFGSHAAVMLTEGELLAAAKKVWELDNEQLENLKTKIIPDLKTKDAEFKQKEIIKSTEKRLQRLQFLLKTWDDKRINAFFNLLPGEISSHLLSQLVEAWQGMIGRLTKRSSSLSNFTDEETGNIIEEMYNEIIKRISPLMYLTPTEIEKITEHEQTKGYLFLDTLAEARQPLKTTWDIALIKEMIVKLRLSLTLTDDDATAMDKREEILNKLVYGGENHYSERDQADRLFRQPPQQIRETPLE